MKRTSSNYSCRTEEIRRENKDDITLRFKPRQRVLAATISIISSSSSLLSIGVAPS
jgi:hypothetical protein